MQSLLRFWYGQSPSWVFSHFLDTVHGLDSTFAVRETLRHITQPLFQDYSRGGRVVGFFFRSGRILAALLTYFLTFLLYLALYLVWLAFPLFCIVSLLGSFLAKGGV